MTFSNALVLDDQPALRGLLEGQLRSKRISVASVGTIAEARAKLEKGVFDLAFLDLQLPDGDGREILKDLQETANPPLVIVMTGFASIESAVDCMKAGVFDYLVKPFGPRDIEKALKQAEAFRRLVQVNRCLNDSGEGAKPLVGRSEALQQVQRLVRRVAPTEATVLITGENGTGKEVVAAELHRLSRRANAPLIKVNCAVISETLIESEFFGHEKGAFTGATQRRAGRFELADGGTLFLDEVSEISPGLQAKLLRVLQEREFERVGGNETIKVDVRVIAATNRDLPKRVEEGTFREDLYYRLNVFPIQLPPLRDREGDVLLLANTFLERFARKHGLKIPGFSDAVTEAMTSYRWPGNVRELQNVIERAVILAEDGREIDGAGMGLPLPESAARIETNSGAAVASVVPRETYVEEVVSNEANENRNDPVVPLEVVEKRHILEALEHTGGNRTRAADLLGISIRTLRNKLSQYNQDGVADGVA